MINQGLFDTRLYFVLIELNFNEVCPGVYCIFTWYNSNNYMWESNQVFYNLQVWYLCEGTRLDV